MLHDQQSFLMGGAASAAQVTFGAAGTGAAELSSTPIAVPFPTGIAAGHFLLLHVAVTGSGLVTITTPAGWTLIDSRADAGASFRSAVFWKSATGSESGNQDVTYAADGVAIGRMYRFSHGSGVEAASGSVDETADTTVSAVNVTTTVDLAMAVQCFFHGANTTIGAITGESGADYTEAVAEFASATASALLSCQVAQVATATAITGGSATAGASGAHIMHGFAIKP
jgi:hypothetical protein